jgi:hypothetical protein
VVGVIVVGVVVVGVLVVGEETVPVAAIRQGTATRGHDVVWRMSPVAGISTLPTSMPETMLQLPEYSWSERRQLPSP